MTRPFHPFAPPAPPMPGGGGCLAVLTVAGAVTLVGLALCASVGVTHDASRGRPAVDVAPAAVPAPDAARHQLARARRSWGAIRAGFRDTNRRVPA